MTYYSQYDQDKLVDKLLMRKKNGVFVEFGANDGVTLSNTYFFEKERKWTGLCVEPIAESYEKLKNNRKCHVVKGCISDSKSPKKFMQITGYAEMLSGIVDTYDPRHLEWVLDTIKIHGGTYLEIEIECYLLNDLLEKFDIKEVDFCSVDTEGGELLILQTIDFDKFKFGFFCIENVHGDDGVEIFLASKKFKKIIALKSDDIYINLDYYNYKIKLIMIQIKIASLFNKIKLKFFN